jgi:DNA-binding PadR family transcriptional regulator
MSHPSRGNPLALAVLALLAEGPAHPYEMASVMRQRQWQRSIKLNFGSLYSVVEALGHAGLIFPLERIPGTGRPDRTVYAITAAGRAEMRAWLAELLRTRRKEYPAFQAGLALLGHLPPAEARSLLEARATALARDVDHLARQLAALREGLPRAVQLESEYELALAEAELAWLRDVLASDLQWPELEA